MRARVVMLALGVSLVACDENAGKAPPDKPNGEVPETDEQSPNARILPEPLPEAEPGRLDGAEVEKEPVAAAAPKVRPKARPWPLRAALPEDGISRLAATGYSLSARFAWQDVEKRVPGKASAALWPTVHVELLREVQEQTARMRWVHTSQTFALPEKSELRSRADRLGTLLLWGDQRSYRVAPEGALRSLYSDRRVDRLPFVEAKVSELAGEQVLGRDVARLRVQTSLGVAELQATEVVDLPFASQLLCRQLFELARVKSTEQMCPKGYLPLRFSVDWKEGDELVFEVLSFTAQGSLERELFRTPPALPIHKKGELPPMDAHPLSKKARKDAFSLGEPSKTLVPVAPETSADVAPGEDPKGTEFAKPVVTRAQNEIIVTNATYRRMLLLLDRVPYKWLEPGELAKLYPKETSPRVGARDFLGELVFDAGIVGMPKDVIFGEEKDVEPPGVVQ